MGLDVEPASMRVVTGHLGVDPEELTPDVSLVDDLAADSLDLAELSCAFEEELGVEVPVSVLAEVRTYRDLVQAVENLHRKHPALRARPTVAGEPVFVWVRLVPARGRGEVQRGGLLTPYSAEAIAADALRSGPGSRLDVRVARDAGEAQLAEIRERLAWLAERGVQVSIHRGAELATRYPDAAA